jgi:RES domain-containing protein
MIVYRLSKMQYADDLSGEGARIAGGRWNHPGTAVVYTAESRALCLVEIAVHTGLANLPEDYCLITLSIPDDAPVTAFDPAGLGPGWNSFPYTPFTQVIGDNFVSENRFLVLKVPSAVVQGDFNYLINPAHPEASGVNLVDTEPFGFDRRLAGEEVRK